MLMKIDVNKNICEILKEVSGDNFVESSKLLKVKYGISYRTLAIASKINPTTLRGMINLGYHVEDTVTKGATNLKNYFLGQNWGA